MPIIYLTNIFAESPQTTRSAAESTMYKYETLISKEAFKVIKNEVFFGTHE